MLLVIRTVIALMLLTIPAKADRQTDLAHPYFVESMVEMAAFLAKANGDTKRADCIMQWYFSKSSNMVNIVKTLSSVGKKLDLVNVVYFIISEKCGKPDY